MFTKKDGSWQMVDSSHLYPRTLNLRDSIRIHIKKSKIKDHIETKMNLDFILNKRFLYFYLKDFMFYKLMCKCIFSKRTDN